MYLLSSQDQCHAKVADGGEHCWKAKTLTQSFAASGHVTNCLQQSTHAGDLTGLKQLSIEALDILSMRCLRAACAVDIRAAVTTAMVAVHLVPVLLPTFQHVGRHKLTQPHIY